MSKQTFFDFFTFIGRQLLEAHVVFVLTALIVGTFFVIKIPLGASTDEQAHDFRAYMVSSGEYTSYPVGIIDGVNVYGGKISASLFDLETQTAWAKYITCDDGGCHRPPEIMHQTTVLANKRLKPSDTRTVAARGAAQYVFPAYLPSAAGFKIAQLVNTSAGHAIELARFTSLLFFAAVTGGALFVIRKSSVKWLLFAVALLPQTIIIGSSVTADMTVVVLSFLLFAIAVRALHDRKLSIPLKVLLVCCAVLVPMIKPPYIFLSFIPLFLPVYPKGRRGLMYRAVLVFLAVAIPLWWTHQTTDLAKSQATLSHAGKTAPEFNHQAHYIVSHPVKYGDTVVKSFLTQDWLWDIGGPLTHQKVPVPNDLTAASYTLLLAGALAATRSARQLLKKRYLIRTDIVLILASVLTIVGIITSLYVIFNPVAYSKIMGVSGRYFIPVLPFLFLGVALASKIKVTFPRFGRELFIAGNITILLATTYWWYNEVYVWALPFAPPLHRLHH